MASSSSSSSPPPPPSSSSSSHQSSSPPFSCSVFDPKDYNTNPSVVVDQQNQTSVIQETTTTTHHQTLGKSEQSVSSAPKHKSTTPCMKTLLFNKKPQIIKPIREQKSRDTKLVMQPKIKKTQPPDENDGVMSTDEEESESAEEEETESAEEESESSEGESERRRRRRRIGRRYPEYVAKPSRSCSEASSEEYNPRERMIMFHESDESEDEDDIRLLEYIQEYKEEEAENGFGNSLPLSLTDGRPAKINVGFLLIYIQKDAGKYHGYTASKLRNKILKMQRKYKKLLREKGDDPTPQDFDTPTEKLHFDLLKNCFQ